jgi:ribosomal protein S18 acetylase RimI-like enzyme
MRLYNIERNKSDEANVKNHLKKCDMYFMPKLSSYTNIETYSKKLVEKASRLEIWHDSSLIALLAYYKKLDTLYITNLSVDYNFQRNALGFNLLTYFIKKYKQSNMLNISLEVFIENKKALKFYQLNGFHVIDEYDNKYLLNFNYV